MMEWLLAWLYLSGCVVYWVGMTPPPPKFRFGHFLAILIWPVVVIPVVVVSLIVLVMEEARR